MPTTVILKGGGQLLIKGDSTKTAVFPFRLGRWLRGIALNGRLVEFKRSFLVGYVFQPEAEWQAEQGAQKAAQDAQAKAQAEAQEKAQVERDAALKVAAEAAVLKYGPDFSKWLENLRPKAPAPDVSQN